MKLGNKVQIFTVGKQCLLQDHRTYGLKSHLFFVKIIIQFCFQGLYKHWYIGTCISALCEFLKLIYQDTQWVVFQQWQFSQEKESWNSPVVFQLRQFLVGVFFALHKDIPQVTSPQGPNSFKKLSKVSIYNAVTHMKDLLNFTFKTTSAQVQTRSDGRKEFYIFVLTSFALPDSVLTIQSGFQ